MSFRVQFTVNDVEYAELKKQADEGGYPTVAEMCKTKALDGQNTYVALYMKMVTEIKKLRNGKEFYLRDIIATPPALLGKWLHDAVRNGQIECVEHLGSDGTNTERYRKTRDG